MKKILAIVVIVIVLITAVVFTFLQVKKKLESYEQQINQLSEEKQELEASIAKLGGTTTVFTIRGTASVAPGTIFDKSILDPVEMPASYVDDSVYVTDLAQLENKLYKVDVKPGTPLVYDLFMEEPVQPTDRYVDIVLNDYPVDARAGEYYDIRFRTQSGLDYIVLSKKRVVTHYGTCLRMVLNEEEILIYGSALFDEVFNEGGMLYATVYVEPSAQKGAQVFYTPSKEIISEMQIDPNLIDMGYTELYELREKFESNLNKHDDTEYAKASKLFSDIITAHSEAVNIEQVAEEGAADANAGTGEGGEAQGTNGQGGLSVGIAQNNNVDSTGQQLEGGASAPSGAMADIQSGQNILNP